MTYDLVIKDGRIIDGSGRPAFHGDVAVARGTIVELGRLSGAARRVIEADGRVVAPGFVDNTIGGRLCGRIVPLRGAKAGRVHPNSRPGHVQNDDRQEVNYHG